MFIKEMLIWFKLEAPEYVERINKEGQLPDDFRDEILAAIEAFSVMHKFSSGR